MPSAVKSSEYRVLHVGTNLSSHPAREKTKNWPELHRNPAYIKMHREVLVPTRSGLIQLSGRDQTHTDILPWGVSVKKMLLINWVLHRKIKPLRILCSMECKISSDGQWGSYHI